jgi:hypothetical protein
MSLSIPVSEEKEWEGRKERKKEKERVEIRWDEGANVFQTPAF